MKRRRKSSHWSTEGSLCIGDRWSMLRQKRLRQTSALPSFEYWMFSLWRGNVAVRKRSNGTEITQANIARRTILSQASRFNDIERSTFSKEECAAVWPRGADEQNVSRQGRYRQLTGVKLNFTFSNLKQIWIRGNRVEDLDTKWCNPRSERDPCLLSSPRKRAEIRLSNTGAGKDQESVCPGWEAWF